MKEIGYIGRFFLINYACNKELKVKIEGIELTLLIDKQKQQELNLLRDEIRDFEDIGILTIHSIVEEDVVSLALDVKNLLSLALGKSITFNRQTLYKTNGEESESVREMANSPNSGFPIIPDFELGKYLLETLPTWKRLSKKEKDDLFVIFDYLNQSRDGFLEDRIFRIAQAWESLTDSWKVEIDLPLPLENLINDLKTTYRDWRRKDNNALLDPEGEIGNKVTSAIRQEKLLLKMEMLASKSNLNVAALNLDFRKLKSLRDQVAHTGKIKIAGKESIGTLESAIKGLQIILLMKLGYTGKVISNKDDWKTFVDISDYKV